VLYQNAHRRRSDSSVSPTFRVFAFSGKKTPSSYLARSKPSSLFWLNTGRVIQFYFSLTFLRFCSPRVAGGGEGSEKLLAVLLLCLSTNNLQSIQIK
jgi:hypothetical protein